MNTWELQSRLKGRSRQEREAKQINAKIAVVQAGIGVSWFIALGRICSYIADFFKVHGSYFFLLSFIVSYISWIVTAVEFERAGNKNLGKIANFIYSTVYFAFYFATGIVFIAAGIIAGTKMLIAAMFIDPLVNLGRAIYFGIKSRLENDPEIKYFFKQRALTHGLFAGVGGLISTLFVLLMVFAAPLGLAISLGILGIGVMLAAAFVVPRIVSNILGAPPQVLLPLLPSDDTDVEMALLPAPGRDIAPDSYYVNTLTTKPDSLEVLIDEINDHIRKIEGDYTRDDGTFLESIWSQNDKRRNKISALEFLKGIINDGVLAAIPDMASEQQPFELAGYLFHYKDKNELCEAISALVLEKFPGAFQSAYKEVGATEACFNKLFLCIIENDDILYNNVPNERDDYSLRGVHAF